ncbi:MAG: hypothetical protein ACYST6_07600 [Planctomycetota bacterium]|jgi:uncharacterized protein Yka (UPF0111/DUF47 family)
MDPAIWERIRKSAKRKTDKNFATEASSLTRLTNEEILKIAPTPVDREKFAELMTVVKDAAKSNQAKAQALRNIQGLAEIAVSLIAKVA